MMAQHRAQNGPGANLSDLGLRKASCHIGCLAPRLERYLIAEIARKIRAPLAREGAGGTLADVDVGAVDPFVQGPTDRVQVRADLRATVVAAWPGAAREPGMASPCSAGPVD